MASGRFHCETCRILVLEQSTHVCCAVRVVNLVHRGNQSQARGRVGSGGGGPLEMDSGCLGGKEKLRLNQGSPLVINSQDAMNDVELRIAQPLCLLLVLG